MENNDKNDKVLDDEINTSQEEVVEEIELSREEQLEKELEEVKADYLRVHADFENFRKRNQEELSKVRERAISNFVEDLLPNIDNFEMSLKMTENVEMFQKGVEMIHQNLLNVLQNHNISMYEPQIGEEFDVIHHEPVLVEHESEKPGTILGVLSKGYKLKDTILRPARVQVVKEKIEE